MPFLLLFLLISSCSGTPSAAGPFSTQLAAQTPVPPPDTALLTGKFDPHQHPDFVAIGAPYTNRTGMFLQKAAFEAFRKMHAAAQKDGIRLTIISSTRTFDQQKTIWETKWAKLAAAHPDPADRARMILQYSAMPGASRHHWGTDIDLNSLQNKVFQTSGPEAAVYDWLVKHAAEYGFCQPYTAITDKRPNGYQEERWHWSYLPIANPLLRQYTGFMTDDQLTGFQGAETAGQIGIVEKYANGINQECASR